MTLDITGSRNLPGLCSKCQASAGLAMVSQDGERFDMCTVCRHCGPRVSASTGDTCNEASGLPDYSYATQRIQEFASEAVNWDGVGGLPASPAASADAAQFLEVARLELLAVPGLAMGGDGSVAVVWTHGQIYISADFDGAGSYSFFVSEGESMACSGIGLPGEITQELAVYLKKHFSHN